MALRGVADEELAAPGVLAGVGHGERPRDVLVDVLVGLALDRVSRAAATDPSFPALRVGIAALDHEVRDHAVELGAVIETRVRELLEVGDGVGHLVAEQLQLDGAFDGLDDGLLVRHLVSAARDRKSTRLNSSHRTISYAVFCLKKKKINTRVSTCRKYEITNKCRLYYWQD